MNARLAGLGLAIVLVATACGGTAAAPSATTGSPAAAATDPPATTAPTAKPATAAPTAKPVSTEAPSGGTLTEQADAALQAFEALIGRPDLTFRARGTVSVLAGETAGTFDIERAVSGAAFSERMTMGPVAVERRLVDGTLYARSGNGAWTSSPASPVDMAYAHRGWLLVADIGNLTFVGPSPLHEGAFQYTATKPFDVLAPELTAAGAQVRVTSLSLAILPTGEPVWMGYATTGRLPLEGGGLAEGEVSGFSDFLEFGAPIDIEAPAYLMTLGAASGATVGRRIAFVAAHVLPCVLALALLPVLAGCGAAGPGKSVTMIPPDQVITAAPPVDGDLSPDAGVSAVPSPSALPDADAAADAVKAFAKTIRDPALSYAVTATLVEEFEAATTRTVFTASVSGADYRGTAKAHGKTVGFAYVHEQGWAKPGKQPWYHLAVHQLQADDAVRPWETLCPLNDLAYTGRPNTPADAFTFACPADYQFQNRRLRSVGGHGRIDALVLVLDAAGTPVSMHVEGEQTAPNGQATPFILDARFKDVGKPVTIKAP